MEESTTDLSTLFSKLTAGAQDLNVDVSQFIKSATTGEIDVDKVKEELINVFTQLASKSCPNKEECATKEECAKPCPMKEECAKPCPTKEECAKPCPTKEECAKPCSIKEKCTLESLCKTVEELKNATVQHVKDQQCKSQMDSANCIMKTICDACVGYYQKQATTTEMMDFWIKMKLIEFKACCCANGCPKEILRKQYEMICLLCSQGTIKEKELVMECFKTACEKLCEYEVFC